MNPEIKTTPKLKSRLEEVKQLGDPSPRNSVSVAFSSLAKPVNTENPSTPKESETKENDDEHNRFWNYFRLFTLKDFVLPTIVFVVLVGIGVFVYYSAKESEDLIIRQDFDYLFDEYSRALQSEIDIRLGNLKSLAVVMELSAASGVTLDGLSRDKFDKISENLLSTLADGEQAAMEWVPRVPVMDRAWYEEEGIKEMNDLHGSLEVSTFHDTDNVAVTNESDRIDHYPVYYVYPYEQNQGAFLLDLSSNPSRQSSIHKSMRLNATVATDPITLVQDHETGILALQPYNDSRGTFQGFALSVNRLYFVLKGAHSYFTSGEHTIAFLYQRNETFIRAEHECPGSTAECFQSRPAKGSYMKLETAITRVTNKDGQSDWMTEDYGEMYGDFSDLWKDRNNFHFFRNKTLEFADKEWLYVLVAGHDFTEARQTNFPLAVIVFSILLGLFITGGIIFLILHYKRDKVDSGLRESRADNKRELAEQANAAKRAFVSYVFHEARVPFNTVVLGIQYLRNTGVYRNDHSQADTLAIMHSSAEQVTRIFNDVLDMQKIEEGMFVMNFELFSIQNLFDSVVWGWRIQSEDAGVHLEAVYDPKLADVRVKGDRHRLKQCLDNFMSNALRYAPRDSTLRFRIETISDLKNCENCPDTPAAWRRYNNSQSSLLPTPEPPERKQDFQEHPSDCNTTHSESSITLTNSEAGRCDVDSDSLSQSSHESSEPKQSRPERGLGVLLKYPIDDGTTQNFHDDSMCVIRFSVTDEGVGIKQSEANRLFKPFVQIFGTQQGKGQKKAVSTGLGLSISKSIILQHRGFVGVNSTYRIGSEFWFTIPFTSAVVAAEASRRSDASDRDLFTNLKSLQVFCVEDHSNTRKIMSKLFTTMGIQCAFAFNGEHAVKLLTQCGKNIPYQLILMDKMMPIMDGVTCTKELRKRGIRVPIIAMTGNAMDEDRDEFFTAGANEVLTKPFQKETFLEVVRRFCYLN